MLDGLGSKGVGCMTDGKLRFYDKGKENFAIDGSSWGKIQTPEMKLEVKEMTHEEMLEEAARREEENKAWEAVEKLYDENGDALQQLAAIERAERNQTIVAKVSDEDYQKVMNAIEENKQPFYRFFALYYYGSGEGVSYWLKICCNYPSYYGVDRELENFKKFIGHEFYYSGIEEPTEEEFRTRYAKLIPDYVIKMLDKKDQSGFTWETHLHFNYS